MAQKNHFRASVGAREVAFKPPEAAAKARAL